MSKAFSRNSKRRLTVWSNIGLQSSETQYRFRPRNLDKRSCISRCRLAERPRGYLDWWLSRPASFVGPFARPLGASRARRIHLSGGAQVSFGLHCYRARWAARRMTLHRWLVDGDHLLDIGEPVCEVLSDGKVIEVSSNSDGWIGQHFVEPGLPVPLDGSLALGSSSYKGAKWPDNLPRPEPSFSAADCGRENRLPDFQVFISYKRGDAEIAAALVADKIDAAGGPGTAFLAPRSLTLGIDFNEAIHDALHRSAVLVAVIGPSWLRESAAGGRQLTPEERVARMVATEVQTAIDRGIPVVPILTEGAQLPSVDQLPASMSSLSRCQGLFLRTESIASDIDQLVASLQRRL